LTSLIGKIKVIEVAGSKTKWKGETADIIVFHDITKVNMRKNYVYLHIEKL